MMRCLRFMVVLGLLASVRSGWAEDAFFRVPWSELELRKGHCPVQDEGTWRNWQLRNQKPLTRSWTVRGKSMSVTAVPTVAVGRAPSGQPGSVQRDLVVRTAAPRDVTGRLFVPTSDGKKMVMVRFKVPANRANVGVPSGLL